MRIRLIQITTRRTGAQARREEIRDDDVLTVGRGTDNDLSLAGLSVSLHHASFRKVEGEIVVEGLGSNVVAVNGSLTSRQALRPGDAVRLGSFELRLVDPGEGADLALEIEEVERSEDESAALAKRTRIGIGRGLLSERALSLLGMLFVAGLALALPWRWAQWSEPVQGLPVTPLARASVTAVQGWSTGPISAPHRQFAQECGRCHVVGFETVRDEECLACHARVEAHATAAASPPELSGARCTSCHTEHRGVHGLSDREAGSCAPCHARLASLEPPSEHAVASNFGSDHPQFRLTILKDPASGARERVTWSPTLEESTGLLFSHLRHVGQAVENRATGRSEYMRCDDCHALEPSGKSYQEVGFAARCQSCHALGFDEAFPEKQALHADPVKMREGLLEFYSAVALGGLVPPGRGPAVLRAAPGRTLSAVERRAALGWAEGEAKAAAAFLMDGDDRCGMCHPIRKRAARDGGDDVAPVQVPRSWLPHAEFSHRSHTPSDCRICHAAITVFDPAASPEVLRPAWAERESAPYGLLTPDELARAHPGMTPSDAASDVSIPGLDDCRTCHLGPAARTGFIASECVLCHGFHRPELPPTGAAGSTAQAAVHEGIR
jgi:pSer/pThr/pTyr-binding forkhead associated (FHA) protein